MELMAQGGTIMKNNLKRNIHEGHSKWGQRHQKVTEK